MKHVQLFEQFLNEKGYAMTGRFGSKGIAGKVQQAFKKQVEKMKWEGNNEEFLTAINTEWSKFQKDADKMITDIVMSAAKEGVEYVTCNYPMWIVDEVNGINRDGGRELYISGASDFVINVGFADDVDAGNYTRKIDKDNAMQNPAIISGDDTVIYGSVFDTGANNLEIRSKMFLSFDAK